MFSKLTLHQALFLLSKFSKLSSTKIRERLLLFLDPKQVICDVFKNNHNKYRSVFNLKSVTKTECFEALKLFGRQQQMGIKTISYLDKEYPFNLEKIADAPILIYRNWNFY